MEHRFFRFGSLLLLVVLIGHVLYEKNLPEEKQDGVTMIFSFIAMAVIGGALAVTWLLPALGDRVSEAMIGSNAEAESTPRSAATARAAVGDYEGAIGELHKLALSQPADRYPVMEIARLYRDKLDDSDSAIQTLHTALISRPWSEENESTLRLKLAELLVAERKDFPEAIREAQAIIDKYPGTPSAGAATSRLREIEEQQFLASRPK